MKRIWKPIDGYEDYYIISNYGEVIRLESYDARGHLRKARVKKTALNSDGYETVGLYKDSKETKFLVHRLVAIAFLDNPNGWNEINHKDECRSNNCVDNLEWCTHKYNTNYGNCQAKRLESRREKYA